MQRKFIPLLAAALLAAGAAQAQDNVVKAGIVRYDTHSRTDGIRGIGVPTGADAVTGDATTVILVYERTLTPNIGAELVLGVPPRIKAQGAGSVAFLGEVLTARNVAHTVLVNYYFGKPGDTWRPYLGAGINHTRFTGVTTTLPGATAELSDSTGLAVQAGVNYAAGAQWGLFASVAKVDVKSDLVAVSGGMVLQSRIDFRPVTYSAGLWYRF